MTASVERARRAVFLDRDGVLNRAIVRHGLPYPPTTLDEFELYPDVPESNRRLRRLGFALVVVTNQPDLARSRVEPEIVAAVNTELRRRVDLDAVYVCPHDDADGCDCRKPAPGLLVRAARELDLDLERSFMVGDRWRDIEAGRSVGCRTVFIERQYRERRPECADAVADSLLEAVRWIEDAVDEGVTGG